MTTGYADNRYWIPIVVLATLEVSLTVGPAFLTRPVLLLPLAVIAIFVVAEGFFVASDSEIDIPKLQRFAECHPAYGQPMALDQDDFGFARTGILRAYGEFTSRDLIMQPSNWQGLDERKRSDFVAEWNVTAAMVEDESVALGQIVASLGLDSRFEVTATDCPGVVSIGALVSRTDR